MKENTTELRILYVCGTRDSLALYEDIPLTIKRRKLRKVWCRIGEIKSSEWREADIIVLSESIHPGWVMRFSRDLKQGPYVISLYAKKMAPAQWSVYNRHVEFQQELNFKKFSTIQAT